MLDLCRFRSWFRPDPFFTGGSVIMDYGLFYLKRLNDGFVCVLKTLTDGLESSGLLVDYFDVFISCLDSHSDGTHSLQRIHCWDSDATFLQIWWRNKLISILGDPKVSTLSANFHFWVNYSFKMQKDLSVQINNIIHFMINFWTCSCNVYLL